MSEIEEAINRMKKVVLIITGSDGSLIRSNLESKAENSRFLNNIGELIDKARNLVRDADPSNDMTLLRFTLKKHEIIIAPGKNFRIIVVQDTNTEEKV